MIGLALLLFLSTTFPTASAQAIIGTGSLTEPHAIALLAITGIFAILFVLQVVHCIIAIIMMRGHRLPYLILLPAVSLTALWTLAVIAYAVVVANVGDTSVRASVAGVFLFFRNWSFVLIFATIIAFLLDRETAIRAKSSGTSAKRNLPLVVIHAALIVLMFIFATAHASASVNVRLAFANGWHRIRPLEYIRRVKVANGLTYTFYAIVIVSTVDIIVTAILLSISARKASISDKVTNTLLNAVSPLYALLNISHFVFLIVHSPVGLVKGTPTRSKVMALRTVDVAQHGIDDLLLFLIFVVLLFMSFNRSSWDLGGPQPTPTQQLDAPEQQQYWAPQVMQNQYQPYPQQQYTPQPYGTPSSPPPQVYTQFPAEIQPPSPQPSPQPYQPYHVYQPYPPQAVAQPYEYGASQSYPQPYPSLEGSQSDPSHPSPHSSPPPLVYDSKN